MPPTILEGHTDTIKTITWLSAVEFISGGADNTLRKWDLRTNKKEVMSITTKGAITSIEVSRDSKQITTAAGTQVSFYNTETFGVIKCYTLPQELNSASLHPDNNTFVVGGAADFYAHVYNYNTGNETEIHKGHHGPVQCVRYAPDGETFATG